MSVTAPGGFVAGGVPCGIRRNGRKDLAIVRSVPQATGAAMFTTNQVQAAPLRVSQSHLRNAQPQAVVINSGVANALTGPQGEVDAVAMASETAALLNLSLEQVLVLSTGVIGVPLPIDKISTGLPQVVASLSDEGGIDAAEAIMTTDTRSKHAVAGAGDFTVGGIAKGSGMIHPLLATMLAIVTTDYALAPEQASEYLHGAVESSFNRISVDGDRSTNDSVILLANGAARAPRADTDFESALQQVCDDLAHQIVADGEGASVVIEIRVSGAANQDDAVAIARHIATSSLVKTAAFGRDPNWGRVIAAAGWASSDRGPAKIDVDRLELRFNGTPLFSNGRPTGGEPDMDTQVLKIDLDLGIGDAGASYLSTDLTNEYVRINADYTT
ncbi:MAG: bifunctional glutamate N-acetyltransferase/amino-acid acetyltransferase ArgJ [Acidimicrobiia bacterium]|nr:MAG: bifunctional glutamate N-acetyltransferase/amino-acid acetyltransferase ArgJ [Acidimicrobiia bacterium]